MQASELTGPSVSNSLLQCQSCFVWSADTNPHKTAAHLKQLMLNRRVQVQRRFQKALCSNKSWNKDHVIQISLSILEPMHELIDCYEISYFSTCRLQELSLNFGGPGMVQRHPFFYLLDRSSRLMGLKRVELVMHWSHVLGEPLSLYSHALLMIVKILLHIHQQLRRP